MLPTILLVDDDEEILQFLQKILRTRFNLLTAQNGKDALEKLHQEAVQLVVSDVMMPVMDGFELCKTIKTDIELCHTPVILLTAKNTIQAKIQGLELKADAYIEKPFSKGYLLAQMDSLISNRNMIKEHFATSPLVHIKSIAHTKADEKFLETLHENISKNLDDLELDVDKLAQSMSVSRITLYRKIKAISNFTPNELIILTRLKKAAELLAEGSHSMFDISNIVGFSSQSNFTRSFLRQFSMTPTEYMQRKKEERSSS
jgi:two-component system, cell cycle response regulator